MKYAAVKAPRQLSSLPIGKSGLEIAIRHLVIYVYN